MRLGIMIKAWRNQNKIGVRACSNMIGISAATLSRIERGKEYDSGTMRKLLLWIFEED